MHHLLLLNFLCRHLALLGMPSASLLSCFAALSNCHRCARATVVACVCPPTPMQLLLANYHGPLHLVVSWALLDGC